MTKALPLLRVSVVLAVLCTLLLGMAYPAVVLGVGQLVFPVQADGSLLIRNGKPVGSALLGQEFTQQKYFWGRLSATTPPYNAAASAGSNFSPGNPKLLEAAQGRIIALQRGNAVNKDTIPIDLVTASGSGLDPHISLTAAEYQIPRIARARGMKESDIRALVAAQAHHWLGMTYVNVLMLNMALDGKK